MTSHKLSGNIYIVQSGALLIYVTCFSRTAQTSTQGQLTVRTIFLGKYYPALQDLSAKVKRLNLFDGTQCLAPSLAPLVGFEPQNKIQSTVIFYTAKLLRALRVGSLSVTIAYQGRCTRCVDTNIHGMPPHIADAPHSGVAQLYVASVIARVPANAANSVRRVVWTGRFALNHYVSLYWSVL